MLRKSIVWATRVLSAACFSRFALAMSGVAGSWAYRDGLFGIGSLGIWSGLASIAWLAMGETDWRWKLSFVVVIWPTLFFIVVVFPPKWLLGTVDSLAPARFRFETDQKVIALSIDDAIHPATTPRILDLLERHSAKATFFIMTDTLTGDAQSQAIAKRIATDHELGNHQTTDRPAFRMTGEEFAADVREAQTKLEQFGTVQWVRPGSGFFTSRKARAVKNQGLQLVIGSIYPWDSHQSSVKFSSRFIMGRAHPGAIIVLHDGPERGERTLQVLEEVLPKLKAQGYRITTLGEVSELPEID